MLTFENRRQRTCIQVFGLWKGLQPSVSEALVPLQSLLYILELMGSATMLLGHDSVSLELLVERAQA